MDFRCSAWSMVSPCGGGPRHAGRVSTYTAIGEGLMSHVVWRCYRASAVSTSGRGLGPRCDHAVRPRSTDDVLSAPGRATKLAALHASCSGRCDYGVRQCARTGPYQRAASLQQQVERASSSYGAVAVATRSRHSTGTAAVGCAHWPTRRSISCPRRSPLQNRGDQMIHLRDG